MLVELLFAMVLTAASFHLGNKHPAFSLVPHLSEKFSPKLFSLIRLVHMATGKEMAMVRYS